MVSAPFGSVVLSALFFIGGFIATIRFIAAVWVCSVNDGVHLHIYDIVSDYFKGHSTTILTAARNQVIILKSLREFVPRVLNPLLLCYFHPVPDTIQKQVALLVRFSHHQAFPYPAP